MTRSLPVELRPRSRRLVRNLGDGVGLYEYEILLKPREPDLRRQRDSLAT